MKRFLLLLVLLFYSYFIYAQDTTSSNKDSIPTITDSTLVQNVENNMLDDLPTLAIDEDELNDNGGGDISSMLAAGRNPFLSAASFNFSYMRFQIRGYDGDWNNTFINGLEFNGLDNGITPFGLWSGVNNMMGSRENVQGLQPSNFGFGSLGINTNVDMRAGNQWAQTNLGYAFSNRNFQNRINLSHSSGFNKNGWAYSVAASGSFAGEGYVPGTYDNSYSFYGAADKKIGMKNTLSFIGFYAPSEYGRQAASVQEAIDLSGTHYYNPSWGYQNGKKRNSNVARSKQPAFILSHEFKPNNHSSLVTSVGYVFGVRGTSAIDWYDAANPNPDYYKNLPSYFSNVLGDPTQANAIAAAIKANPNLLQMDWDNFYNINRNDPQTINDANGSGNSYQGNQSHYILGDRDVYTKHFMASTNFSTRLSDIVSINAGANYGWQQNHYYEQVEDLLGGDFWLNASQYAQLDYPNSPDAIQYDLNHPNGIKKVGDHYGYDYDLTYSKLAGWFQTKISLNHFDLFWANQISYSEFYRTGNARVGLFPDDSYGKGETEHFVNGSTKVGATYKLNGRNYFYIDAGYLTEAPSADNAYISPRTRQDLQADVKSETIESLEGGYDLNTPFIKLHVDGYLTKSQNGIEVINFFDDVSDNFGNYAINSISRLYFGGEFGAEVKLSQTLSLNAAAAVGRAYYDNRPNYTLTVDNSGIVQNSGILYLKNYRLPVGPQNAYSMGLKYNSPKYWFIGLTGNYTNNTWVEIDPARHTSENTADINTQTNPALVNDLLQQEKINGAFTLDFIGGWDKRLRHVYIAGKPVSLVFSAGVNNLTNNKNIKSGGFEQLRSDKNALSDYTKHNNSYVDEFPPKYYYALGLNYYISVALRF